MGVFVEMIDRHYNPNDPSTLSRGSAISVCACSGVGALLMHGCTCRCVMYVCTMCPNFLKITQSLLIVRGSRLKIAASNTCGDL